MKEILNYAETHVFDGCILEENGRANIAAKFAKSMFARFLDDLTAVAGSLCNVLQCVHEVIHSNITNYLQFY